MCDLNQTLHPWKTRIVSSNGSDKTDSEIRQWHQQRCRLLEDRLLTDSVWLSDMFFLSQWNCGRNGGSSLWTNKDMPLGQWKMVGIMGENGSGKLECVMNQRVSPQIYIGHWGSLTPGFRKAGEKRNQIQCHKLQMTNGPLKDWRTHSDIHLDGKKEFFYEEMSFVQHEQQYFLTF